MLKNRVRFAPAPSGFMHIGNVTAVIINYLYALENDTDLILRIEDTDELRVDQKYIQSLYSDLDWLGIKFSEGPREGGSYGPYLQSERTELYKNYLDLCIEKNLVYRCFATPQEIEQLFNKQKLENKAPRYIKDYFRVSKEQEELFLLEQKPYVYRFEIKPITISFNDKAHGLMHFDLSHFSDPIIVRSNGSFTFLFANLIDDVLMDINYVIRGEDHISNSALQVFMYNALGLKIPMFYHLPLIVDHEGKKLSKRNFGFSLNDLMESGFLKEGIINYILLMGHSLEQEIFTIQEAASLKLFESIHSKGTIKYDYEKLLWINSEWMKKIDQDSFYLTLNEYINTYDPDYRIFIENHKNICLMLKNEIKIFSDIKELINPFFETTIIKTCLNESEKSILNQIQSSDYMNLVENIKKYSKANNCHAKELYSIIRRVLTGSEKGISLKLLFEYLRKDILEQRYLDALKN